jgi:hypothetical protein
MTPYDKNSLFFKWQQFIMHRLNVAHHILFHRQVSMRQSVVDASYIRQLT